MTVRFFLFYQAPGCTGRQKRPCRSERRKSLGGWQSCHIYAQAQFCLCGSGTQFKHIQYFDRIMLWID